MAIVNGKSTFYTQGDNAIAPNARAGVMRVAHIDVANAAGDLSTSTYKLCSIPADAYIDPASAIITDTWGFATVNLGTWGHTTSLATAARGTATTILNPVSAAEDLALQPAWQMLGLSAPPENGLVDIIATASADATGAGSMKGKIVYRDHT